MNGFQFIVVLLFLPMACYGQTDTLPVVPLQESIEDFLQNSGAEGEFDFNTLFENLEGYLETPLNLNTAEESDLRDLGLLSDAQILQLLQYRNTAGDFIAIQELQAIPSFDLPTIRRLLPYVTVASAVDDYQESIATMLSEGANELYLRWSRILETQAGYEKEKTNGYLGDPNQLYIRYKHSYSNKLSYGITAEKDRGEELFKGSNQQGFDFYSAHFYLRDYNSHVKAIALGDYSVSLGQGLILFSGFGAGKGAAVTNIKRSGRVIRPYSSVNEANFMRGAAATLAYGPFEVTAFASYRGRDGNVSVADTLDADQDILSVTSLDIDGYHRTSAEIADENALHQLTVGGSARVESSYGHVAVNALFDRFDKSLIRSIQPYNRYYFQGRQLLNASVDYAFVYRNLHFFGETAVGDNGVPATLNGILIGLDRKVDFSALFRHFPRNYVALNANPFSETSGARNETGLYLGLEVRPMNNWKASAYFDAWKHPWLRFDADAPSSGYEYRGRLTYTIKRKLNAYLEIREEVKQKNAPETLNKLSYLTPYRIFQTRMHVGHELTSFLELRTRVDWGYSQNEADGRSPGFAIYQDAIFQPIDFPLHFTTRFAIFDTQGYSTRFYSYENDLLYAFSIPAYYNKGTRFYINLRYRGIRNMVLEMRYAQTYWKNQSTFGSGTEAIAGQAKSQVSAQVKWRF